MENKVIQRYDVKKQYTLKSMREHLRNLHHDENGATATEYIILLILVACFIIAIVKLYGITVSRKYQMSEEVIRKEVDY